MKERPILFSAPMVRAILDGRKTQTRRIVKGSSDVECDRWVAHDGLHTPASDELARGVFDPVGDAYRCPYGEPGDRLWVRESCWLLFADYYTGDGERAGSARVVPGAREDGDPPAVWCAVDGPLPAIPPNDHGWRWARRNSIHMPRYASRILLDVVSVRVERLQDISEDDARAEGVTPFPIGGEDCWSDGTRRSAFEYLWGQINGFVGDPKARAPWASNPWVWVVTFKRTEADAACACSERRGAA